MLEAKRGVIYLVVTKSLVIFTFLVNKITKESRNKYFVGVILLFIKLLYANFYIMERALLNNVRGKMNIRTKSKYFVSIILYRKM